VKAIILAAGKGTRISDEIGFMPKSLLEINGKCLIRNITEMLISFDIQPIICTGYQANKIKEALTDLNVQYCHNPFYDITNNISSLWFARENIDDDIIILSADLIFQKEIIEKLIRQNNALTMIVDKSRIMDGDYFLRLSDAGYVLGYGSDMPPHLRSCEYIGLSKISRSVAEIFAQRLDEMIKSQKHQQYFEQVFFSFIDDEKLKISTIDISGLNWREVDFYDDYLKAKQQFETN